MKKIWWDGKPWQAFKNFALIFSFLVNLVVVIALLLLLPQVKPFLSDGVTPLVQGLNQSFEEMSQASIKRTIEVDEQVPIDFNVPLDTSTTVTVTEQVPLRNVPATFYMTEMTLGNGGVIRGSVSLDLPADLALPVELALDVPVQDEIPIKLAVGVDIPLEETELNGPFTRLKDLFAPLAERLERFNR